MRRRLLLTLAAALLMAGCNWLPWNRPVAMIDWTEFVKLKGITYDGLYAQHGRTLTEADLGDLYDQVRFKVAGNITYTGYKTKDGDAASLEPGTKVYRVKGYDPRFRVAAMRDGQWILYEADTNPAAKTGADLLDLEGKVSHLVIRSMEDHSPLAEIRDPVVVQAMVTAVLEAPVFGAGARGGEATASENRYGITFVFQDGTATTRTYWTDSGFFWAGPGLKLPGSFAEAVRSAAK